MTTLALNVIVGPGEAGLLSRCLRTFSAKESFDEIVIVNTSNDTEVEAVAKQYTEKVVTFAWESERHPHGNFGGARNCALDNTSSDMIMWLDSDDVCLDQYKEQWTRAVALLKDDKYADVDMWSMPYAIIVNEDGSPSMWFKRERVFKRNRIKWTRPIHELLTPEWDMVKNASINNMFITHLPSKPTYASALRNIAILEHEHYTIGDNDIQTRYFLGRDYLYIGKHEKGIGILEGIVQELETSYEMLYAISMELVWFYAFGCQHQRPVIEQLKEENIEKIEDWCRMATAFSFDYAEPYVVLGDVYFKRGDMDAAMRLYKTALKKKLGKGKFQTVPFYEEVPAYHLARVYSTLGMYGMASHYNQIALSNHSGVEYVAHQRNIVKKMTEEFNELCKNEPKVGT